MSIVGLIIAVGVIAIIVVLLRAVGIAIPQIVLQILGIVAAVVPAVWAVRFVMGAG